MYRDAIIRVETAEYILVPSSLSLDDMLRWRILENRRPVSAVWTFSPGGLLGRPPTWAEVYMGLKSIFGRHPGDCIVSTSPTANDMLMGCKFPLLVLIVVFARAHLVPPSPPTPQLSYKYLKYHNNKYLKYRETIDSERFRNMLLLNCGLPAVFL